MVCADKISFDLGKNGYHRPNGLASSSIVVVSEWDEALAVYVNFLNSEAHLATSF